MADINQLKYQARREEQRNNWSRAIELYSRALEKSEETLEIAPDVSLYNRIGDLHLRQNDTDQAISFYLKAVDRYAEQGLHPGAIALCNKILRVSPSRVDVHRKLGRLHVATGLIAEARASFREYATRMEERGEEDLRLEALFELATLTEDDELHLDLVADLVDQDREQEAVERLQQLVEMRLERDEDVEELRNRIRELDPSAVTSDEAAEPTAAAGEPADDAVPAEEEERETVETSGLDYGSIDLDEAMEEAASEADAGAAGADAGPEAAESGTEAEVEPEEPEEAVAEPTAGARELEPESEEEIEGLFEELDEDRAAPETAETGEAAETLSAGRADPEVRDGRGVEDDADVEDEADVEDDAEVSLRYAKVLQKNGQTDEAIEQLEETLRNLLRKDAPGEALPVAERLMELDPGNPRAQKAIAAVPAETDAEPGTGTDAGSGETEEEVVPFSVSEEVASDQEEAAEAGESPSPEPPADVEPAEESEEAIPDFTGMLQNMGWLGSEEDEESDEEEDAGGGERDERDSS